MLLEPLETRSDLLNLLVGCFGVILGALFFFNVNFGCAEN